MDFILTKKPLRLITKFRISNNGHFILVEPVRVDHKETDDLVQFLFKQWNFDPIKSSRSWGAGVAGSVQLKILMFEKILKLFVYHYASLAPWNWDKLCLSSLSRVSAMNGRKNKNPLLFLYPERYASNPMNTRFITYRLRTLECEWSWRLWSTATVAEAAALVQLLKLLQSLDHLSSINTVLADLVEQSWTVVCLEQSQRSSPQS